MIWLAAFAVSFVYVSAKAAQQLNVQHDKWRWVLPCSLVMAFMEVSGVLIVMRANSLWLFIPIGTGGAMGCLSAMFLHRRLRDAHASK